MNQHYCNWKALLVVFCLATTPIFAQDNKQNIESAVQEKIMSIDGTPSMIVFKNTAKYSPSEVGLIFKEQLGLKQDDNFKQIKSENDRLGFVHEKHQQLHKGLKVEFGTYTLHSKGGAVKSMNGEFHNVGEINITPTLSKSQAFERAIAHTGAQKYLWEYPEASKEMDNYKKPEGELLILPGKIASKSSARLVYKFDIYALEPLSRGNLYIDAKTGEALFFNPVIKHATTFGHVGEVDHAKINNSKALLETMLVGGSAQTRYSGTQSIETAISGSNYTLNDASRKVYTRDALNQAPGSTYPYISNYSEFTDNDNNWTTTEHSANKDDAALDAHWGAMMTYDYFNGQHNRDSYDGNGAQIRSYVHVDNNYDNAFWNGSVMSYGDGSSNGNEGNGNFDALTSIDVAAHEIGHAICSNTADLAYQRESGGLNEGFSDIWGAAVEHFAKGNGNDLAPDAAVWLIGDEIDRRNGSAALRSMSNPNSQGQPDTYRGTNWQAATAAEGCTTPNGNPSSPGYNDYCGVHTNSGVLNHWFYLLTAGGSGTNDVGDAFSVNRIGLTKAANIAYRLESVYLSANSTFADARTGGITAATDLYGAGSAEVISTTNAFYAVGVGAEYVQTCALAAPSNLGSSSIGDNGFTLNWNAVSGAGSYDVSIAGNVTNVSGTSYNATGLAEGTTYTAKVRANCSAGGNGAYSSDVNVTTTGTAPLNYCSSTSNSTSDEYISRVQLGSIDNSTGAGANGYSDHTGISTALSVNASATITVTPTWTGTIYDEGYSVWIDYNQDGDFTDSGEQVWTAAASKTTPVSGSFTVPSSATSGSTRMRVSMKYNGVPTSCETLSYGEVEDYTVVIGTVVDNTAPVITLVGNATINLNVGDTYTEQGATATDNVDGDLTSSIAVTGTVNTSSAGTYTVNYNVSDAAGNAAAQVTRTVNVTVPADITAPVITLVGNTTINLNVGDTYTEQGATATDNVDGNLTSSIVTTGTVNTAQAGTYTVNYNVSDAAGNAATQLSRSVVVTEAPSGCAGGITSFPYSEGFESGIGAWSQSTSDDINWTVNAGGTPSSSTGPSSATEGSNYLYIESSGNGTGFPTKTAILNSPCVDLTAESGATFSFSYHMYGSSMGTMSLEASTDGTNWTSLWSLSGNQGNSWSSASVDLAAYVGSTVELRYVGTTSTSYRSDMAIDKLSMTAGTPVGCNDVTLTLVVDQYPEETSWAITDGGGATVASGAYTNSTPDNSTVIENACLPTGCYTFTINDVYGDGICCTYGNGSYNLEDASSTLLASGGSFTSSQATNFCVGGASLQATFARNIEVERFEPTNIARLYPNPVSDYLYINAPVDLVSIKVITVSGTSMNNVRISNNGIEVSSLKSGIYMVLIQTEKGLIKERFVKQ